MMKLFLSLFAAALVAGTLSAADATTSATKPQKEKARPGAGAMSGMMDLRKALTEDESKAMREGEGKVKAAAQAYKKEASEANAKALKDQIAANYDARIAAFQKVVDRTTDATEKAKFAAVVKTLSENKDTHLQKAFEMATMERPQMPKGEKKNKK